MFTGMLAEGHLCSTAPSLTLWTPPVVSAWPSISAVFRPQVRGLIAQQHTDVFTVHEDLTAAPDACLGAHAHALASASRPLLAQTSSHLLDLGDTLGVRLTPPLPTFAPLRFHCSRVCCSAAKSRSPVTPRTGDAGEPAGRLQLPVGFFGHAEHCGLGRADAAGEHPQVRRRLVLDGAQTGPRRAAAWAGRAGTYARRWGSRDAGGGLSLSCLGAGRVVDGA